MTHRLDDVLSRMSYQDLVVLAEDGAGIIFTKSSLTKAQVIKFLSETLIHNVNRSIMIGQLKAMLKD